MVTSKAGSESELVPLSTTSRSILILSKTSSAVPFPYSSSLSPPRSDTRRQGNRHAHDTSTYLESSLFGLVARSAVLVHGHSSSCPSCSWQDRHIPAAWIWKRLVPNPENASKRIYDMLLEVLRKLWTGLLVYEVTSAL